MRHAQYLYKSRHSIYYSRAVVPQPFRIAFANLPKR